MERGERAGLYRVEESIYRMGDTSIPRLWGGRPLHLNHQLEQGKHHGSVVLSAGQTRVIPRILGKEVKQVREELS